MKLFDRISEGNEEVEISSSDALEEKRGQKKESRLKNEVEEEVVEESSTNSSTSSSSSLPGMGSGSSGSSDTGSTNSSSLPGMSGTSSGSKDVDVEDVHEQNEKIIDLLRDIKSEVGGNDQLL